MMIYPVIVPNDKAIVGEVLSMTFKAYNDKGKSGSIKSRSFKDRELCSRHELVMVV